MQIQINTKHGRPTENGRRKMVGRFYNLVKDGKKSFYINSRMLDILVQLKITSVYLQASVRRKASSSENIEMVWRQNDDTQKGFWKREEFQKDSFVIGTEVPNNYYRDETTHMLHLEGYYGLPFQGTAFI